MRRGPNTLAFRLFFFTSLWMVASLAVIAVMISADYRRNAEARFGELITANLYNLMGSFEPAADGQLTGAPQLGDGRYAQFNSGWYWSVHSMNTQAAPRLSPSLAGAGFPDAPRADFDENFQRIYRAADARGNPILVAEGQVFLGEGDDLYTFRVSGNLVTLNQEITDFRLRLVSLLALFGLGLVLTSYFVVRVGLRPLIAATVRLGDIREGRAESLHGRFPKEIQPLIDETNALIVSNRSILERARTQVGNLAHSLKTPLSVLQVEADKLPARRADIFREQLAQMQSQVQSYLNRAMVSARHGTITSRTKVAPALARLVRVMTKLNPELDIRARPAADETLIFAGEQQDLEEIAGNLLENAAKWAKSTVQIGVERVPGDEQGARLRLTVGDDGPGLSTDEIAVALKRGARVDTRSPGTGLGLSIVTDIVGEYGGTFELGRSGLGGLEAVVILPAA